MPQDRTTLICLFHHREQAQAALEDILEAGVTQQSVSLIEDDGKESAADQSLSGLMVPERDQKHLLDALKNGGTIVAVSAIEDHVALVERIFGKHKAEKIDEAVTRDVEDSAEPVLAPSEVRGETDGTAIPIVEEELVVGKRTVDAGGVRLYRRVVEIPVEESVTLRQEEVFVDRHSVDRPATNSDLAFEPKTIELTETAEEAVVGKEARVVEEVLVGKDVSMRTEHIHESVRKTEVEIEQIEPIRGQTY